MNTYWVSVAYDRHYGAYCDEFTIEANSMDDAHMKAAELLGWNDCGDVYIEEIKDHDKQHVS